MQKSLQKALLRDTITIRWHTFAMKGGEARPSRKEKFNVQNLQCRETVGNHCDGSTCSSDAHTSWRKTTSSATNAKRRPPAAHDLCGS